MSNLKYDKILGREVLVSDTRLKKPSLLGKELKNECPFCEENRCKIDKTIFIVGDPWRVKVVLNKYPIVNYNSNSEITGIHYVVIEGQKHNKRIEEFTIDDFKDIFMAYKVVVKKLENHKNIKYIQIFKNYKREAGISIEHQHSQIVALSFMPKVLRDNLSESTEFFGKKLWIGKYFDLIVPGVQLMDYTLRIYSKLSKVSFSMLSNYEIEELAKVFKIAINLINNLLGDIAMNICYYFCGKTNNEMVLFVDIVPRKSGIAGFELATGIMINTIDIETCYNKYKDILMQIK